GELPELPVGEKRDEAAVGRPERLIGACGARQRTRRQRREIAKPELPFAVAGNADKCQVTAVRRDCQERRERGQRRAIRWRDRVAKDRGSLGSAAHVGHEKNSSAQACGQRQRSDDTLTASRPPRGESGGRGRAP